MDTPVTPTAADPLEESFDLLARQEKTEGEVAARDAFDVARLRSVTAKVKEMDDAAEPARVSIHELLGEGAGALGGARVAQLLKERAAAEGG